MKGNRIILFGLGIDVMNLNETLERIVKMAKDKKGGRIYCCTLNEVMMADEDENFKNKLKKGDILTTDGMPLVWLMKKKVTKKERVYGPDLLEAFLKINNQEKLKNVFIGDPKNKKYFSKFGRYLVLPFKEVLAKNDLKKIIEKIKEVKTDLVWISLGGKKQIEVADELVQELPDKVFITVGAAFDFLAGTKKQAPLWMRKNGLEWLFRLINEPKRLGKRYLKIILYLSRQVVPLIRKKVVN